MLRKAPPRTKLWYSCPPVKAWTLSGRVLLADIARRAWIKSPVMDLSLHLDVGELLHEEGQPVVVGLLLRRGPADLPERGGGAGGRRALRAPARRAGRSRGARREGGQAQRGPASNRKRPPARTTRFYVLHAVLPPCSAACSAAVAFAPGGAPAVVPGRCPRRRRRPPRPAGAGRVPTPRPGHRSGVRQRRHDGRPCHRRSHAPLGPTPTGDSLSAAGRARPGPPGPWRAWWPRWAPPPRRGRRSCAWSPPGPPPPGGSSPPRCR